MNLIFHQSNCCKQCTCCTLCRCANAAAGSSSQTSLQHMLWKLVGKAGRLHNPEQFYNALLFKNRKGEQNVDCIEQRCVWCYNKKKKVGGGGQGAVNIGYLACDLWVGMSVSCIVKKWREENVSSPE